MNTLRQAISEYLDMRRSLGFKLQEAGRGLYDFADFMERHHAPYITQALALAWAQQSPQAQPDYWAKRLGYVRGFAQFRSLSDPRTEIPPSSLLPFQPKRARPYIYSDQEISSLLQATLRMPYRYKSGALLPWTYYCLFGLLSVTGMRLGEVRNLKLDDVDLDSGVLTIHEGKCGKSRLLPLHKSTCRVLTEYMAKRQRHWQGISVSPYFFVSSRGNQLDNSSIRRAFYAVSRQVGLRGATASHGPRLYDLRHRFATKTLVNWYRSGQDPERRLPLLSAYLGHVHVADTHWYLESTPELMHEAMRCLEQRWEGLA